jgi:hypothetical protein
MKHQLLCLWSSQSVSFISLFLTFAWTQSSATDLPHSLSLHVSSNFLNINYGKPPAWLSHTYQQQIRPTVCSLEFLGYSLFPTRKPGQVNITFTSSSNLTYLSSRCFYHIMSEKWRPMSHPFYSMGIFYCPIIETTCKVLTKELLRELQIRVNILFPFNSSSFLLKRRTAMSSSKRTLVSHPSHSSSLAPSPPLLSPPGSNSSTSSLPLMGICVVLPYSPSDEKEKKTLQRIASKWLIHHNQLGFHIFLYDHDQLLHSETLVNAAIGRIDPFSFRRKFHYFNFTMYSVLSEPFKSENLIRYYDNDKVLTLTHCRFDARASHGIEKVTQCFPHLPSVSLSLPSL